MTAVYVISLCKCLVVDYCKLLSKENETKHQIRDCIQSGNDEETVTETTRFDVPLVIPEGYMFMGVFQF